MGKKKLDELFQEKFNDFEQVPDDTVWQAIEASLDKKKRRVIPLWWKLSGAAVVLALVLLAINPFADPMEGKPALTDIEQNENDSLKRNKTKEDEILDIKDANKTRLTETNSQDLEEATAADDENHPSKNANSSPKTEEKLLPGVKNLEKSQFTSTQKEKSIKINPKPGTQLTAVPETKSKRDNASKDNLGHPKEITEESAVAQRDTNRSTPDISTEEVAVQQEEKSNPIKDEKDILNEAAENTAITQNDVEQNDVKNKEEVIAKGEKKSIFDEIKEQEEEVIAESEPRKRWSAGPSVAPVYFDAFGEGSPVHSILVPNSKSGDTNLSYGLTVNYEINDRLSVRSGLHKVAYGYDTGDVEFSSSLDGSVTNQIDNIDYASTAGNLVVRSKAGPSAVSVSENVNDQAFDVNSASTSIARNGSMSQQFGYLEVPLELNYALIDRKVGINLVGGFSSLFLLNNSVSLTSGNETTQLGEANNVNNINFSTNIGLGIDYHFTPRVKLNIEPLFKYQLNTFSDVDGTFNPFSVGVYSGLTFKF